MAEIFRETFGGFTAAGFAPTPGAGQLDSDVWVVTGFSDSANPSFGFTGASGTDFGRGIINGDPTSAGIYATAANTPTYGSGLLYQPTGGEGDLDGTIVARIQNTTGTALTDFTVSFDWLYRNTGPRASSLVFEYSTNGSTFTLVTDGAFTTPGAGADQTVLADTNTGLTLNGVSVEANGYLYLRWRHDFSTGSGNRDEFGIDNVVVNADGATGDTTAPSFVSSTPADNATAVAVGANLTLTFNEAVKAGAGTIVLDAPGDANDRTISITDASQVTINGSTVTINPAADLAPGTAYDVIIAAGVIEDVAGNDFAGLAADQLDFTTAAVRPVVTIAATDATATEGSDPSMTFTLTRSGDLSTALTVSYAVAGSGAAPASAADYADPSATPGSVTFAAG